MNVEAPLEANAQFAETCEPGMRALVNPAMPSKSLRAISASSGDASRDSTLPEVTPTAGKVVALVCMQSARAFARLAIQAAHCRDGIDCSLERHRVVPVGPCDRDGKRNAPRIYNDVPFRAERAPLCRVGASFWPRGWKRWLHQGSPVPNQSVVVAQSA